MAITKLDTPIKMTSSEVDRQYHGRWVAFHQPNINEPGLVYGYSDVGNDDNLKEHEVDYSELKIFMYREIGLRPKLVHGCKDRGRTNLHVEFFTN